MKKKISGVFLFLLFAVQTSLPADDPNTQDVQKYLSDVREQLLESYAFSDRISSQKLVNGGKKELIRRLLTKDEKRIRAPQKLKSHLLKTLKKSNHRSLRSLVTDLEKVLEKTDSNNSYYVPLADAVAAGMIKSTGDPFSKLMTLEDVRKLQKRILGGGTNKSLGLHVAKKNGVCRVNFVMYGSAAYHAGIRVDDVLVSVEGEPVAEKSPLQLKHLLEADYGESVPIRIRRNGWKKPLTIDLQQKFGVSSLTESRMLPGRVGYVRLTMFGFGASSALKKALSRLRNRGMRYIILDLRNNPGGAVNEAVSVCDLFISDDRVITRTETHYSLMKNPILKFIRSLLGMGGGGPIHRADTPSPYERMPMAVLINHSSASASEMTAGALQDQGRALLFGQKSYGKGVGQTLVPLMKSSGIGKSSSGMFGSFMPTRFLYLTVMKYYLPSGRSIHGTGLEPDIMLEEETLSRATYRDVLKLRTSRFLKRYVETLVADDTDASKDLALYDGFSTEGYSNFQTFRNQLKNKLKINLSREQIRREVRRRLRQHLDRGLGEDYVVDLQSDSALQAALLRLTK